jgi:RNA-binding protein
MRSSPVLLIGQHGLTAAVIAEAQRALHDHELIKVKFRGADREGLMTQVSPDQHCHRKHPGAAYRSYSPLLQTPN